MNEDLLRVIYERAALCRAFEEEVARRAEAGEFRFPVYLSIGQEYVPATVATWLEDHGITDRQVFVQHRAHSQYISFGGDLRELVLELRGDPRGCSGGMGGTNCLQSKTANIYGHDALLGTQVPIAVGACYGNRKPTVCFMGDAAAEEDWTLAALGWAATKNLPILFVVEDNNPSILTEKRVRRSWHIDEVAYAFGLRSVDVDDDPAELYAAMPRTIDSWPALLNVHTTRLRWHAGPGVDDPLGFDRHAQVGHALGSWDLQASITVNAIAKVRTAWQL